MAARVSLGTDNPSSALDRREVRSCGKVLPPRVVWLSSVGMVSISWFQYGKVCCRPVPFLMRSKFARCLQTTSTSSHDSSLGLDESPVKKELNLDALSVQVRVVGAMSIYLGARREQLPTGNNSAYHDRQWPFRSGLNSLSTQYSVFKGKSVVYFLCVFKAGVRGYEAGNIFSINTLYNSKRCIQLASI